MRRDHSKIIWRTVVFAGAMLGTPACGGKANQPATTPANASSTTATTPDTATTPTTPDPNANPCNPCNPCGTNPCDDRIRGGDDEEGGMGRGFILS